MRAALIETGENELAAKRRSLDEVDTEIGDARAEVQRLQNEIATLRSQIEFNRQRGEETGELIGRYTNDRFEADQLLVKCPSKYQAAAERNPT